MTTTSTPRSSLRLLDDLPADVWTLVAAYLPPDGVLAGVCRRLPPDVHEALLPRHVNASAHTGLLMRWTVHWTRRLETIVLHNTYWPPMAWQAWVEALPLSTLRSLKLRRCNVPWDALQRLVERAARLHTLWIEEVLNVNAVTLPLPPDLGEWIAALVRASGATLKSLSLAHNDLVLGADTLRALLACPGLEELRLLGNYAYWSDDLRLGPTLRRVSLGTNPSTGVGPTALLGTLARPLEALTLQYEVMPQPCMCRHILAFAPYTASPHLKTLKIRGSVVAFGGSWEATCRALRDLLRACPALETLDLGNSVVNTSFVATVLGEAGPALRCFRAGLCMVDSWVPTETPLPPREMHTFRTYWNLPGGVLDSLHGLVDLDLAHLTQTSGLYRALQRNARTLRRLRLDHAMLPHVDAFMCGRVLAAQCGGLEELSTRHWSAESTRELLHGMLAEAAASPARFRALRRWHYATVYMDARLLRLLHQVLAKCPRLERYEHVRVQGAGGVRWEAALRGPTSLRVWDFTAADVDSEDVRRMLACLAAGASPWLREWRLDHNPEIKDDAFENFAQAWARRPLYQRDRLRVLSLRETGMTCFGLRFVCHLRLRVLEVLAALSTSYLLESWLLLLLHARPLVTEQVRLPFALYGTVDPDILHRLLLRGTQVLPSELVD